MWWLRELRYTRFGKMLIVVLVLGAIGGGSLVAFRSLTGGPISVDDTAVAPVMENGTVDISVPLTPGRATCERSKLLMSRTMEAFDRYGDLDEETSNRFLESYSAAVRSCTYSEFIEFDRDRVYPWSRGQVSGLTSTGGAS